MQDTASTAEQRPLDPYDQPPPWWQRHASPLIALSVFAATVLLTVIAFPPFNVPEFAYAFAAPAIFWAYRRPNFRLYAGTVLAANAVAWTILLGWLHHVTWVGLFLLGPFVGIWIGLWYLAAWWTMPKLLGRGALERIVCIFGLAALWVVIEWTRTWVLSGFPWLPLSASQWKRVSILQIAAYTGAYGVSFVLMAMNLGFAAYAHRLLCEGKRGLQRRSQEFFACLFLLIVCVTIHVQETFNHGRFSVPLGRIGIVQPYVPQSVKWDPTSADKIRESLEQATKRAAAGHSQLLLWPEASTPWAVKGDPASQAWIEQLVRSVRTPLLLGSIAIEQPPSGEKEPLWFNGAFVVDPVLGLQTRYYVKRHLVPFGEYIPLRPILGWLDKFVPIGGDFQPGVDARLLTVNLNLKPVSLGTLICYEDIFPMLAVESVRTGAEALVVLTNNAWYGEGGAAYQQAAHSVLRAVETRRPVLRCGNGGWSGWIDEYGNIRSVLADEDGSVYVRGSATIEITHDRRWSNAESFYVKYGDWFVAVCTALAAFVYALLRLQRPVAPSVEEGDSAAADESAGRT